MTSRDIRGSGATFRCCKSAEIHGSGANLSRLENPNIRGSGASHSMLASTDIHGSGANLSWLTIPDIRVSGASLSLLAALDICGFEVKLSWPSNTGHVNCGNGDLKCIHRILPKLHFHVYDKISPRRGSFF